MSDSNNNTRGYRPDYIPSNFEDKEKPNQEGLTQDYNPLPFDNSDNEDE